MKKLILFLVLPCFFLGSCLKSAEPCKSRTVQSEEGEILAYAASHGMNVTRDASGLYYEVVTQGTGPAPSAGSNVSVIYTGKFTNDNIFDQSPTPTQLYPLNGYIQGWKIGLPLIQKGGEIRLIIPSSLAYGCQGRGPVPGDAILYFDVQLVDVQ